MNGLVDYDWGHSLMMVFVARLRRLGAKQLVALGASGLLGGAAVTLAFTTRPELSIVPTTLLLLHLTLQAIVMQSRLVRAIRDVRHVDASPVGLDTGGTAGPVPEDVITSFERIEYLQKRILATVEAERAEAAERHQVLLGSRSAVRQPSPD